ncbi:MAG TPA: hypothetical protein VEK86_07435 [Gemmatimonadales bacterium]|nr:hypothetical protein [Gemmatimonadales bacterium]
MTLSDDAVPPKTEEKAQLVPPGRVPPTAVGAATPPPPPPAKRPQSGETPERRRRPALWGALQFVRKALGAVLDVADALAGAVATAVASKRG